MEVETFLVGSAIDCIVAQRLARKLCEKCKKACAPPSRGSCRGQLPARVPDLGELFRPTGCGACSNTGYRGRIGLYEVMQMTEEIERLTVDRASSDVVKAVAVEQGMKTLRDDGLEKAASGLTVEEIARVVKMDRSAGTGDPDPDPRAARGHARARASDLHVTVGTPPTIRLTAT